MASEIQIHQDAYSGLNADQRRFVDCYVDGAISVHDAVLEANFAHFEDFTPHEVGRRLMASPAIQQAIIERTKLLHDQGVADAMWYLRQLVDYANTDFTELFTEGGTLKTPREWPKALRKMIRKIKFDEDTGHAVQVEFEPKTKIYELIGRTDLVSAFEKENDSKRPLVLVKDMTVRLESNDPVEDAKDVTNASTEG